MLSALRNDMLRIATFALLVSLVIPAVPSFGQLRKAKVGDDMPEFSLPDANGVVFDYKSNHKRVLAVAFLSAGQKQSERAAIGIESVVKELGGKAEPFDFVIVVDDRKAQQHFQTIWKTALGGLRILLDPGHTLWGQLGIIAKPTVLVVRKDGKVKWIKAGYGYDFVPSLRRHLESALGIVEEGKLQGATEVKTLAHGTTEARVRRHLQMEQKGRMESAIEEVAAARQLDPNSIEVALALGELYCKTKKSKKALQVAGEIKTHSRGEQARVSLTLGWAKRQMGELDAAEQLLLEATKLDPKSIRGHFELGKVYQARGQNEKAMKAYYRALSQVLDEPAETDFSHH
ncbi:MAG: tetratricopeptide repeat protein [Planctomycetota bacterium]|jgi:tetratricopeptide (TPR) repeat protein